jgi:uncharacterized heparinase superfamily protein
MPLAQTLHSIRYLKPSQIAWRAWYMVRRKFKPAAIIPPPGLTLARPPEQTPHTQHAPAWDQTTPEQLAQGQFTFFNQTLTLGSPLSNDPAGGQTSSFGGKIETSSFGGKIETSSFDGKIETSRFGGKIDWKLGNQSQHRLWIISLHYHSWLYKLGTLALQHNDQTSPLARDLFTAYLDSWLQNADLQAPGSRALAWNAYACSTRLSWWARLLWQPSALTLFSTQRRDALAASIWKQARFIETNLEYDLRANHLLRDFVGLAYAGRLLEGPDAARWREKGSRLGIQQVAEQVLPDGGHFERSPMYHLHVMEDVLALACLAQTPEQRTHLRSVWVKMAHALQRMVHPDGLVTLLNDAAFNGSETPSEALHAGLRSLSASPELKPLAPIEVLPDFGLIRLQSPLPLVSAPVSGPSSHSPLPLVSAPVSGPSPQPPTWTVFFDVGPIGVDYQPGHAHADTLTLEASYLGQRLLIDPGTLSYDRGPARTYDRSTASHNTLTIDGKSSSEVWDIFRVARRARPLDVSFANQDNQPSASASHDGYDRLPGKPRHSRTVHAKTVALSITDVVTSAKNRLVSGGFLFAPGVKITPSQNGFLISLADHTLQLTITPSDANTSITTTLVPNTPYHPNFGDEILTNRIQFTLKSSGDSFSITSTFTPNPR